MPPKKKLRTEAAWEYEMDGSWSLYDAADSTMLEKEYVAHKSAGSFNTSDFSFNKGYNTVYTIDLDAMTQKNNSSGTVRKLRRIGAFSEFSWEYQDDNGLFVQFYEADANEIESLYRENGLNAPAKTKKLSWNKGYNSLYTFVFTTEKKDKSAVVEVAGTQTNEDSGKVRNLKRTPKKQPWAVEGYGISGDKDALAQVQAGIIPPAAAVLPPAAPAQAPVASTSVAPQSSSAASASPSAPPAPVPSAGGAGPSLSAMIKAPTLSLPHYWEKAKMFDAVGGHHEVTLAANSEEFASVSKLLLDTIGKKVNVVHVIRLENAAMYSFYAMTRMVIASGPAAAAAAAQGKSALEAANEKFLFTGERIGANMLAIKKFGFDTRVVPANGDYGQGLYFGAKASFADNGRCIQNADGTKDMFVCRVAVGNAALGAKSIRRPPPLDPKKPTMALYDSCVDDLANPQTYIIFNNKQAYPEYIIRYI